MVKRCPKCNAPLYCQHIDKLDEAYCHHCGYKGKFSDGLPITNADWIRNMTDEELANLLLFYIPITFKKPMYVGISGRYTETAEETINKNLEWLKHSAEEKK